MTTNKSLIKFGAILISFIACATLVFAESSSIKFGPVVSGGGSGDVATDDIWVAAEDLLKGSGAGAGEVLTKGTDGEVLTMTAGTVGWATVGSASHPVTDTTALVQDPVDATKLVRIDAGGLGTGTTRVIIMPAFDVDLGNLGTTNLGTDSVGADELNANAVASELEAVLETSALQGVLLVTKGGTAVAALTDGGVMLGSGTSGVTVLAQATDGELVIGSTGVDPVLAVMTGSTNEIEIINTAGGIEVGIVTNPTIGVLNITGTIPVGRVGTDHIDATTEIAANMILELHLKAVDVAADEECLTFESTTGDFEWQACGSGSVATDSIFTTAGDLVQGTGSSTSARLGIGTNGQLLATNAGATAAEWIDAPAGGTVDGITGDTGAATNNATPKIVGGTNATTISEATTDTITVNVDDAFLINDGDDATTGTLTVGGLVVDASSLPKWEFFDLETDESEPAVSLNVECSDATGGSEDCDLDIKLWVAGSVKTIVALTATGGIVLTSPTTSGDAALVVPPASIGSAELVTSYLPLAGGTMTAEFTADALGIEFEPGDAITNCTSFAATGGGIFYDDSDGKFKKCEDNVLTDMDTSGGAPGTDSVGTIELDDGAHTPLSGEWLQVDSVDQAGVEYRTDAEARTDLGLVIGTNVQAWDAELDTIAALTETNGNVMFVAGGVWTSDPTPAIVGTDISGTATAFTASNVTTNANLTGPVTSSGNATAIATNAITDDMVVDTVEAGNAATVTTNANLTGPVTSSGNATAIATDAITDDMVVDSVTATDYLLLTGGTISSTLTTDDLVVDGVLDTGTREIFGVSDGTPDVGTGSFFITNATQAVPITDFDGAGILAGQLITVESNATFSYTCIASGLQCGSTNISTAAGDLTTWLYDGTDWHLIAFTDQSTDMGTDSGAGSVTAGGAPGNDQVAVWTGASEIEGNANLTFTGTLFTAMGNRMDTDGVNLQSGDWYEIADTLVLDNDTLGTGVVNSSLTGVGALATGSIVSGFTSIALGTGTISGSTVTEFATASAIGSPAIGEFGGKWFFVASGTETINVPEITASGQSACFYGETAIVMTLSPSATDRFVLDGVLMAIAEDIKSPAELGTYVCIISEEKAGTDIWRVLGKAGTWVQETP